MKISYYNKLKIIFTNIFEITSFNRIIIKIYRHQNKLSKVDKVPPFISEIYQVIFLLTGIFSFFYFSPSVRHISIVSIILVIILFYRTYDIFMFSINWIFLPGLRSHSILRNLAGFILNLLELIVYFASLYLAFGFYNKIFIAFYSSLRISFSFEPFINCEPFIKYPNLETNYIFLFLVIYQIFVSAFLLIVVISNIVGTIKQGEGKIMPTIKFHTRIVMDSGKEYIVNKHPEDVFKEIVDSNGNPYVGFKHFLGFSVNPNYISSIEEIEITD